MKSIEAQLLRGGAKLAVRCTQCLIRLIADRSFVQGLISAAIRKKDVYIRLVGI